MVIKALLFDIGGVLYKSGDARSRRKWERRLGLSQGQLAEIVFTNPVALRAAIGHATPDDVWLELGRHFSLSPENLTALRADFWNDGVWDIELLDFIRSIKTHYKTGTVSDAWLDARQNVKHYVNSEIFDVIVFSAEEGVMKPDPEIYRRALARLGVAAQEAIFVDDRLRNIVGARQIGMRANLHTETNSTITKILRLLQTQS
jgi:HAD superfamily hydrolase (TIGR01549 family)